MFPVDEPGKAYAINLVLIDSQGVKIEACIKKNYLNHEFKIFFNLRTRVVPESSDVIPTIGLSLKNSADIEATLEESDFLIGKLTPSISMKDFFFWYDDDDYELRFMCFILICGVLHCVVIGMPIEFISYVSYDIEGC
ncbi:uncharacterized protein LOC130742419 [Lotus japonicus]|uniref:uncharacterized protein LOC130742419 n=1 Tax=Lotus japonicus TaxID=34305 RepID=UPI00258E197D|nr:uncharacterized protein LOC130742419 [Lotus japonicus]